MNKMMKRTINGEEFHFNCYAPGGGTLEFCWLRKSGANLVADGPEVTIGHAKAFLRTKEGKRLLSRFWELRQTDGVHYCLVKKITREGQRVLKGEYACAGYLRIHDSGEYSVAGLYHYTLDAFDGKHVFDPDLHITVNGRDVGNWSIRMVVRYFLENEKELTDNPPLVKA